MKTTPLPYQNPDLPIPQRVDDLISRMSREQKVGQMLQLDAREGATTGVHWTFSPVLDVTRDLRWGRVNETFGEDTYLIGELASAMVRGYQGGGAADPTALIATAKHFAGYSETQGGRDASEADLSHRKLRSWFLPPYERVAKEGVGAFMLGYQTIDGVPITINDWLLTDVLRGEWNYGGTLVTDWDNVGRMVWEQKVQPDYKRAAAAAVLAGNDMVMTTPLFFEGALEALEEGLITDEDVEKAVRRILTLKFELGLFEDVRIPQANMGEEHPLIGNAEHQSVNLQIARESVVLLQNDGTLPISMDGPAKKVAVIGHLADDAQSQLGDWAGSSGQIDWMPDGHPRSTITTVLDGIREVTPDNWEITTVAGPSISHLEPHPDGPTHPDGQPRWPIVVIEAPDQASIDEAVAAAEDADYVVAVVGDRIELVGEGRSTATLELVGGQVELLNALAATGKPLIVVLMASKPLVLPQSALDAQALLWVANPGQQGGRAIAEIIAGITEPTGRLSVSFPRHVGQQPAYYNQIRGQHGDRYADLTQDPLFAFGEGRSYTTVVYGEGALEAEVRGMNDTVRATIPITNSGDRPTVEVVQGYVRDLVTSASWADKELKTFARVPLAPGETKAVEITVPVADCTIVNAAGARVVEPGDFQLLIGSSSKETDLQPLGFTVTH